MISFSILPTESIIYHIDSLLRQADHIPVVDIVAADSSIVVAVEVDYHSILLQRVAQSYNFPLVEDEAGASARALLRSYRQFGPVLALSCRDRCRRYIHLLATD